MNEAKKEDAAIRSNNLFPVVGIGASAGGLDAFRRFLKAIPEGSGMAYILVQHLDPAHESILPELLQRVTKLPVHEITDKVVVVPEHIYIIPANKLLTATDGLLQLSERPTGNYKNMPIDLFFASLAEVHQGHAIGVILSGSGNDGTLGLKAIKEHGGITFAQEPSSAAFPAMPQNAIDTEMVDFILPPEQMPQQLTVLHNALNTSFADTADSEANGDEDDYRQILLLLRTRKGVDFTYYKQTTIRRRIARRIALSMQESIQAYSKYLADNETEQDVLYQDMLIPVTQFFRDAAVFEMLCDKVFPLLLKEKPWNEPLRIWISGCSTGEEAYSFVMCLHEYLGDKVFNSRIQLFATDISEVAIAKARSGIYKKSEVSGLSPAQLQQFFVPRDGKFQLNKSIRESCVFAAHNFLKDPPFAKMDLISCRNVMIYMEPVLQKRALTTFHYALKEGGFLVLGKSETTGQSPELYNVFDKHGKIYTRKAVAARFMHRLPERDQQYTRGRNPDTRRIEKSKDDFQKNADEVLLLRYAPPGVVVNQQMDIVQFRGATGMWLEQSSGRPDTNLLKIAREGMAFELRNALHKVKSSSGPFVKADIPIVFMGAERLATIEVIPLLNTAEPHFLILFRDTTVAAVPDSIHDDIDNAVDTRHTRQIGRIKDLQKELSVAREDMRSITEEQEAVNEELQSANEELLSGSRGAAKPE